MAPKIIRKSVKAVKDIVGIAKADTYNPNKPRKAFAVRIMDNVLWKLKYHETNRFYNLYNMDVVGQQCINHPEFIDYLTFYNERNKVNALNSLNDNHIILLRDKHLMGIVFNHYGIPTAKNIAVVYDGIYYDMLGNKKTVEEIIGNRKVDFFLKTVSGECADGVFHMTSLEQLKTFQYVRGKYILQERLVQHPGMDKLWKGAINTCRICTLYDGKQVTVLSSVLRVGTEKSKPVDNWAHGGISVGVHEDGSLVEYGVYKPSYGGRAYEHPNTGVKFSEFVIPEYDKAIELCKQAHLVMREIPAIGWDIAITTDGPMIIEGNDNWEISLMQASNHGLKREWENFMFSYKQNRGIAG